MLFMRVVTPTGTHVQTRLHTHAHTHMAAGLCSQDLEPNLPARFASFPHCIEFPSGQNLRRRCGRGRGRVCVWGGDDDRVVGDGDGEMAKDVTKGVPGSFGIYS